MNVSGWSGGSAWPSASAALTDRDQTAPNHCPQRSHVRSGAEPQKDSARPCAATCAFGTMDGPAGKQPFFS